MKIRLLYWIISLFLASLIIDCSPKAVKKENTEIYYPTSKGELKEFDYYRITRRDLRTFKEEGIPDSIINKLKDVEMMAPSDSVNGRSIFIDKLVEKLGFDDAHTYKNKMLYHAKRFLFIEAEAVIRVEPDYPKLARRAGLEGLVVVKVLIDTMGNVIDSYIFRTHPFFDEPSLKAANQFKFTQGIVDDPVKMWMTIPFTYRLKR